MRPPTEKQATSDVAHLLAELLGEEPAKLCVRDAPRSSGVDCLISLPHHEFYVEYRVSASSGPLAAATERLKNVAESRGISAIPLIAVPFMGQVGRDLCEKSGISWLDLSGNARITAPGLRIWIEGRPNRFPGPGRPPNLFAPKSSRIARQLLLEPHRFQSQSDLARRTELDDGYVSKIVRRLKREALVVADGTGGVRPRDPGLLLDAWHSACDFSRHRILKGHVPARSGEELLKKLPEALSREALHYAVTGLGAAWLLTRFASFRICSIYLRSMPTKPLLEAIDFWDEPKGANTWLVVPNDEGVFHGGQAVGGIQCVSAIQVYLDLKDHPERAGEAAAALRERCLNWNRP